MAVQFNQRFSHGPLSEGSAEKFLISQDIQQNATAERQCCQLVVEPLNNSLGQQQYNPKAEQIPSHRLGGLASCTEIEGSVGCLTPGVFCWRLDQSDQTQYNFYWPHWFNHFFISPRASSCLASKDLPVLVRLFSGWRRNKVTTGQQHLQRVVFDYTSKFRF